MKMFLRIAALCGVLAALVAAACAEGVLTLPAELKTIEAEAFYGVASASKVVVPEGTEAIEARAFAEGGFSEIRLPATVTDIGEAAFRNCGKPTDPVRLYCLPKGIRVGANAFEGCRARLFIDNRELPYFTYTVDDAGVTITGLSGSAAIEAAVIPDAIEGKPVVAIASNVFKDRNTMTRVVIPATVTAIGSEAFRGCSSLTEIELPAALTSIGSGAFWNCSSLAVADIPAGVTSIGASAFRNTALTEAVIPAGVTEIAASAFQESKLLTRVVLPDGLTAIGDNAFNDCYALAQADIPAGVTSIGYQAFRYCEALTQATIPAGVTELADSAFINCKALERVQLPATLTALGEYAFEGCRKLTEINFPAGLTSIGKRCFHYACYNQPGLPVYTLPEDVEVGESAFAACGAALCVERGGALEELLKSPGYETTLTYPDRLDYRYQYKTVDDALTLYLTGYAGAGGNVVIPEGPTVIGESVFKENATITGVTIPAGVTTVDRWAFESCANLARAVMPDSIVTIGDCAFKSCAALTDVVFPAGLRSIGSDAFNNACTAAGVHLFELPDHVETLGWNPFKNCGAVLCFNRGSDSAALFQRAQYVYTYAGETDYRFRWYDNEGTEGHQERLLQYLGTEAAVVEIPDHVWLLDDDAFRGHAELTRVVIPEGVTRINANVFRDCANLTDVTFPDTLTHLYDSAFGGCGSATQEAFCFQLPADIGEFGRYVFDDCPAILVCGLETTTAARISNRGYAFVRKDREEELDIRYRYGYFNNNQWVWALYDYVGDAASVRLPDDCVNVLRDELPDKVAGGLELVCGQMSDTSAGLSRAGINFTFPGHEDLRYRVIDGVLYLMGYAGTGNQIVVPEATTYIQAGVDEQVRAAAFKNQETVTKVVLPEGLTCINSDAFANCYQLTDITFPDSLKSIDHSAFLWCGRDAEDVFYFVLPDNLEELAGRGGGANTFGDCNAVLVCGKTSQTAALLSDRNYVYTCPGEYDYRYRYETYPYGNADGRQLWLVGYVGEGTTANIPAGIYGIRRFSSDQTATNWRTFYADGFYGNERVTKVVIPEGTVTIRSDVFTNCYNLTDITFPSTLKSLDQNVFLWCGRDAEDVFYFVLPDNLEELAGRGGGANTFGDCNAVLVCGKTSQTAKLLSDRNYVYTCPGEYDYRYRYETYPYDNADGRQLWLVGYVGEGTTANIPAGIYGIRRFSYDQTANNWRTFYGDGFYDNGRVTKVVIPEGTQIIEDSAFLGTLNLADVTFPSTLKVLKNHAFEKCGRNVLERHYYVLPDDMTEVSTNVSAGWGAFTDIGNGRLVCAPGSETARLVSNVYSGHNNGSYYFALKGHETDGLIYRYERYGEEGAYEYRMVLWRYEGEGGEVTIPADCGVYAIAYDVFNNRDDITKVVIPEGVERIGDNAFNGCDLLHGGTVVDEEWVPEGMEIDVIELPEGLKSIGARAFKDVGALHDNRFYLVLPASLEEDGFSVEAIEGCNAVFVAPAGSVAAGALHNGWYFYYNTLEDAVNRRNVRFRQSVDDMFARYGKR